MPLFMPGLTGATTRRQMLRTGAAVAATLPFVTPLRYARAQSAVKLGILLPTSGHLALIGQACQRAADLAPAILADRGLSVELMNADTQSSPEIGRTQAEKLIREGADVLIGCFDSGTTNAVAQVAEQQKKPFVINIAADPKITEQGYRYVFRNFPTAVMLLTGGLGMMNSLFEASGTTPSTAVFLHVNDTFGTAMAGGIGALMPRVGVPFEVVDTIAYDPKARDLQVEVARAKATGADIAMVVTRLNDAILMVREMVRQRYNPMGILSPGSPGMYEKQFFNTLGPFADYAVTNVPWLNPQSAMTTELGERFTAAHPDQTFELNAGFTFEAVLIAADAAARAGSNDADALVEALRATNIAEHVMTGGPIAFDETGQNTSIISAAVQNRNGEPHVVLPSDIATLAPVFPAPAFNERR